jgi:hypothetical protein
MRFARAWPAVSKRLNSQVKARTHQAQKRTGLRTRDRRQEFHSRPLPIRTRLLTHSCCKEPWVRVSHPTDREVSAAQGVSCLALPATREEPEVVAAAEPDNCLVKVVSEDQEEARVAEAVVREECSADAGD